MIMAGIRRLSLVASRRMPALFGGGTFRRSYGAAAAHWSDDEFDDYYSEEEEERRRRDRCRVPENESVWGEGKRMLRWVFIGSPGVEKSNYAKKVAGLLRVPHISMGALVREELLSALHGSPASNEIALMVHEGKLLPDNLIMGLLSQRVDRALLQGEAGFILDGFPKTRVQAEMLSYITDIDLVVNFKCMEDCLIKKHLRGVICSRCAGLLSSNCCPNNSAQSRLGSMLNRNVPLGAITRSEEALKEKLQIYMEESKPLEEFYRRQHKLVDFEVARSAGDTWRGLLELLQLKDGEMSCGKLTA